MIVMMICSIRTIPGMPTWSPMLVGEINSVGIGISVGEVLNPAWEGRKRIPGYNSNKKEYGFLTWLSAVYTKKMDLNGI